jgi:hypothetical protein
LNRLWRDILDLKKIFWQPHHWRGPLLDMPDEDTENAAILLALFADMARHGDDVNVLWEPKIP